MGDTETPQIRGRNDFPPPADTFAPSMPPKEKVTLQMTLSILLGLLVTIAFAGAVLGVVDKSSLSNIISLAAGGVLGLLTGGNRIAR